MEVTVRIALILILKCLLGTRDIFLELKTNRGGCGQKMLNFPHCAVISFLTGCQVGGFQRNLQIQDKNLFP